MMEVDRRRWGGMALAAGMAAVVMSAAGCGDFLDPLELDADRRYAGSLSPLNGSGVTGSVEFIVDEDDDEFMVAADAAGLTPYQPHAQHVHEAPECPTMTHDANGDGWLDALEAMDTAGSILVALDSDLSAVAADSFPTSSATGRISYEAHVPLTTILAAIDTEPFAPDTRTYMIHGVHPDTDLPATVQTIDSLPAHRTVPVACAEIEAADR